MRREQLGLEIEFEKRSVYDVANIAGQFDYVFFMGVFYHLRYPLFALDKIIKKVAGETDFSDDDTWIGAGEDSIKRTITSGTKRFFPTRNSQQMYFIEHRYADDPTNWWIPNASACEAMLRSSGLEIVAHPETETWICEPRSVYAGRQVHPGHGTRRDIVSLRGRRPA